MVSHKLSAHPHYWRPQDLQQSQVWCESATGALIDELQKLAEWTAGNLNNITVEALKILPTPAITELAEWVREQTCGPGLGVAKVRGLPADENLLAVASLAIGISVGRVLDNYGRLYQVYDRGGCYETEAIPISQTRHPTGFHTDSARRETIPDIVSLTCVRDGIGGDTQLVSAVAVYRQLVEQRPHWADILQKNYIRAVVTPGTCRTTEALLANQFPIFELNESKNSLNFRYMRYWIEEGQRLAGSPIDETTIEALDWLDQTLADPKFYFEQHLHPGEILWIANRDIAHARNTYQNKPDEQRLFYRMWMMS